MAGTAGHQRAHYSANSQAHPRPAVRRRVRTRTGRPTCPQRQRSIRRHLQSSSGSIPAALRCAASLAIDGRSRVSMHSPVGRTQGTWAAAPDFLFFQDAIIVGGVPSALGQHEYFCRLLDSRGASPSRCVLSDVPACVPSLQNARRVLSKALAVTTTAPVLGRALAPNELFPDATTPFVDVDGPSHSPLLAQLQARCSW